MRTNLFFGMKLLCELTGAGHAQDAQATLLITTKHITEALSKAHPSVPPAERRRLEAVYDKFSNNRDPNIGSADHKGKGKQLATLA
jgi:hypothetical protein